MSAIYTGINNADFYASAFIAAVMHCTGADSFYTPSVLKLGINGVYQSVQFNGGYVRIVQQSFDCRFRNTRGYGRNNRTNKLQFSCCLPLELGSLSALLLRQPPY